MITEDYVSFETAKLLKEKGFNERLFTFYITDEAKKEGCFQIMAFTDDKIDNNHSDHCYLAPTLQMAMKWLREVYKLHIEPHIQTHKNYNGNIYNLDGELLLGFTGESPEQACEVAIKYCLEYLI